MPSHFAVIRYLQESVDGIGVAENTTHLDIQGQMKHQDEFMLSCPWDHVCCQRNYQTSCKVAIFSRIQCRSPEANIAFPESLWQRRTWTNNWNEFSATQKVALALFTLQTSLCSQFEKHYLWVIQLSFLIVMLWHFLVAHKLNALVSLL